MQNSKPKLELMKTNPTPFYFSSMQVGIRASYRLQVFFRIRSKQFFFGMMAYLFYISLSSQATYNAWLRGNFSQVNYNSRSCISADGEQVLAADYMIGTNKQINLTKVDINGFVKWSYNYGDAGDESVAGICLANDGGLIVTGTTTSYSGAIHDIFVLKTDSVGTVLWYKTFNNGSQQSPRSVAQTTNGNICVAGCYDVWNYGGQPMAATMLFLDGAGGFLSFQALNFNRNYPVFMMVQATPAGGFILSGGSGHVWDYFAVLAAQTDAAGTIQWIKTYRGSTLSGTYSLQAAGSRTSSWAYCVRPVSTGYLIGGYTSDHDQYGTSLTFRDGLLLSLDLNGNILFTGQYPNGMVSDVYDVAQTTAGQFSAAGIAQSGANAFQYILQNNGTYISSRNFGTSANDHFYSLNTKSNGDIALSGRTDTPGYPANWLVQTDGAGTNICLNAAIPLTSSQPIYTVIPPVYTIATAITPSSHVLTKTCACVKSESFCPVTIPPADFVADSACANSPVTFQNLSEVYSCPPTFVWDYGDGTFSYTWDSTHVYADTGTYVVTLYIIDCFNDTLSAQHTVNISNPFNVDLGADTTLCDSATLLLDAGNPGYTYLWNTNQNTQTITAGNQGWYGVAVSNGTCVANDSIFISVLSAPDLGGSITNCEGADLILDAGLLLWFNYVWSTGESTQSIHVSASGTYWVVVSSGNCTASDTVEVVGGVGEGALYFPNTFTPDGNGLNEIFTGVGNNITSFHLEIFNRWGQLIFSTDDIHAGWNGSYKGRLVQNDLYVYVTHYTTDCTGATSLNRIGHVWLGK